MTDRDVGTARRFTGPGGEADCTAILVTYNSADDIQSAIASLRLQCDDLRLRVIVVDNGSRDATRELVGLHQDVVLVNSGDNLGFAGGINAAAPHLDPTASVLVMNADVALRPGCLVRLMSSVRGPGLAAAVPRILESNGGVAPSLRREPSVLRTLGDALFGAHWRGRPSALGEIVYDDEAYRTAHAVEWATGAVLVVGRQAWRRVGAWDERFFLYSEETDFFRRLRDLDGSVVFVPSAEVTHRGGGSGRSVDLDVLLVVNRVRYHQKHHGWPSAFALRSVLALGAALRLGRPSSRPILKAMARRRAWSDLPGAGTTRAVHSHPFLAGAS